MNLILLSRQELEHGLAPDDPRARHILEVLGFRNGEAFDAAIPDGPLGRARLLAAPNRARLSLEFKPSSPCPPPEPGTLLCGLCRPQTMRRVIRDCATLGIGSLRFFPTEKGEPSYAQASLWKDGEVDRLLLEAAQQSFNPRLASVLRFTSLESALESLPPPTTATRTALDNYEADAPLRPPPASIPDFALAVGSERGWSSGERRLLRQSHFSLRSLGPRVLRTETAALAGLALLRLGTPV